MPRAGRRCLTHHAHEGHDPECRECLCPGNAPRVEPARGQARKHGHPGRLLPSRILVGLVGTAIATWTLSTLEPSPAHAVAFVAAVGAMRWTGLPWRELPGWIVAAGLAAYTINLNAILFLGPPLFLRLRRVPPSCSIRRLALGIVAFVVAALMLHDKVPYQCTRISDRGRARIVVLGDSVAAGFLIEQPYMRLLADTYEVVSCAENGAKSADVLAQLEVAPRADRYLVHVGFNGLTRADLEALKAATGGRLMLLTYPSDESVNDLLLSLGAIELDRAPWYTFQIDGLHPNLLGSRRIAAQLRERLP